MTEQFDFEEPLASPVEEELEEVSPADYRTLTVYSRDWTVDTIVKQIELENIDLEPEFQRRNVWDDGRKSRLIESLIVGIPIPQLVLAENPAKKRSFVIIDGKQRLLSIAGFTTPHLNTWLKPRLTHLVTRDDLNGLTYKDLKERYPDELRELSNADVRCTVISNYKTDALYEIFSRLNTGSVPLSTQELRQVLCRGPFADYLFEITETEQPIHKVLRTGGPDKRLIDIEIILRFLAIKLFAHRYTGDLKKFLDDAMNTVNADWPKFKEEVARLYADFNGAIALFSTVLPIDQIGRKVTSKSFESRFNRVLFEVQIYYAQYIDPNSLSLNDNTVKLRDAFKQFCATNATFRDAIESTTKSLPRYYSRFALYEEMLNKTLGTEIKRNPFPRDIASIS